VGTGEGELIGAREVGKGVGDKFATFITAMVADIYGLQTFTSEVASKVTVRVDDEDVT